MRHISILRKDIGSNWLTNFFVNLRYTIFGGWLLGLLDGLQGQPTSHQHDGKIREEQAFYEKQASEHFYQKMLRVEASATDGRHRLEAIKQLAQKTKADCDELSADKKQEIDDAARALQESLEKYGFSAWSVASIAQLIGLFIFELPLNYLAFAAQGDAPAFTASAVLAVSVIIPAGAHLAGERLKQEGLGAKLTGVLSLLLLVGLIVCIAVFRMQAFQELALSNAEIARLNSGFVTGFYLIVQLLFVLVAVQKSHSHSKTVEKVEAIKLKIDKRRYRHARADFEKLTSRRSRAEQEVLRVGVEQSRLEAQKLLRLNSLASALTQLIEVYRRSNFRWRKAKGDPAPPSWLQPRFAWHELRCHYDSNVDEEPIHRNGHKQHLPAHFELNAEQRQSSRR